MAGSTVSVSMAYNGTLTGNDVDVVTVKGRYDNGKFTSVLVENYAADGGANLWVTVDGSDPAAGEDENVKITPGTYKVLSYIARNGTNWATIKLVGDGAGGQDYQVIAL